jgi:DNA-binding SARP family transcriptional activator
MAVAGWKLRAPELPRGHLARPRLAELLAGAPVACVAAPVGYGKTVLLTECGPGAWYTVAQADRDPAVLVQGLAAALGGPEAGGAVSRDAGGAAGQDAGLGELCRLFHGRPGLRLAVDDLHVLEGADAACRVLSDLLVAVPPGGQVLLAGRTLPFLPALPRLRLGGRVAEVGPAALSLTEEEALALAHGDAGVAGLAAGWPAALVALKQTRGNPEAFFAYLEAEVLDHLPPERRLALALQAAAAGAAGGTAGGGAENVGGGAGNVGGGPGTMHPLLAACLGAWLRRHPADWRAVNREAALKALSAGREAIALDHALAAADVGLAEPLLRREGQRLAEDGDVAALEHLLGMAPDPLLEAMPDLMLAAGEAARRSGRPGVAVEWLQKAAAGFAAAAAHGELIRALCRLALAHGDLGQWDEAGAALRQVEAELPAATGAVRAEILQALAAEATGRGRGAPSRAKGLEVELLGGFRIRHTGQEITPDAWGRARARGLVEYLLLSPAYTAGREELLEALWPDREAERSRAALRVTLHQARKALQSTGCDLEASVDRVGLPAGAMVVTDLAAFRAHLAAARRTAAEDPGACLEHCRAGRAVYRGDLLPDAVWPWAEAQRQQARRELIELLQIWQGVARHLGQVEEAIGVLEDLLAREPGLEEAEQELLRLLVRTGRRAEALQRYRQHTRWLRRELGLDPRPETAAILREGL